MMIDCFKVVKNWITQSPMADVVGGLGFNLCVAPFLNICVHNLPQRSRAEIGQKLPELGHRCGTRGGKQKNLSQKGDESRDRCR